MSVPFWGACDKTPDLVLWRGVLSLSPRDAAFVLPEVRQNALRIGLQRGFLGSVTKPPIRRCGGGFCYRYRGGALCVMGVRQNGFPKTSEYFRFLGNFGFVWSKSGCDCGWLGCA
jgi:hypothetical protein